MGECPLCGESTSKPSTRLIKESCGHSKCRLCLLNEENGCSVCEGGSADISLSTIESIGNFDYRLPATTIPNFEDLDTSPRKLDFNKIPDAFNDCHLDVERLAIGNSPGQDIDNEAKAPRPQKVDISTETEDIVEEEEEEEEVPPQPPLSVQRNTHSSFSPQVTQTPTQPVQPAQPKLTETFANTIRNNHVAQQETPIVQNTVPNTVQNSFIPVTQRADGRQFITIAFIANNSPNKNQHVVTTPILNQCLPAIGNMTAVQRPGGNQCIPVIGNLNALQNPAGGQFIIRNPNIVQNLMGNQSIPIIGNMNAMQNLTGPPSLTMMGNVNAAKNITANQPLPSFATVNALQSQAKGQSFSTAGNPNVVQNVNVLQSPTKGQSFSATGNSNVIQNVVGNQPYQATQAVSKPVEIQPAPGPAQETVNTPRRTRTRGLPRIKTVKNVNIMQKSLPNQSDKVSSKVEKSPGRGRRQRKELPVYLVPRKPNEKAKSVPAQSPTPLAACMSPEYKLEDYLLFNKQQQNNALTVVRQMQTETKVTNHTQVLNKPSESVINESLTVNEQYNCIVTDEKTVGNKVDVAEQQGKVPNDVSKDEKTLEDLGAKTAQSDENQDLNVIFNIRDEDKQTVNEEIGDEKEQLKIPNGETSSKEEYQNLDALFDIIEKESEKLNGGIFDKEVKHDLNEGKLADMPDLHENMDMGEAENSLLDQAVDIQEGKGQDLKNETVLNHQKEPIETLNNEISDGKETRENNLSEINNEQEQSVINEFSVENSAMQPLDEEVRNEEEKQNTPSTEMECEETKTQNETNECQNLNGEIVCDNADSPCINDKIDDKETNQTLNEEVDTRKEDLDANEELSHEKEEKHCMGEEKDENQYIEKEIPSKEENNSHNENESNDDQVASHDVDESTDNKEKINQTLYEDISDVENDSGESNCENPDLQAISGESNDGEVSCHCSDENTVDGENQVLNDDDLDEESNQNETIEAHQEENTSSPSNVDDEPSPTFETNDPESNELDEAHENEETDGVEKPRESPEKSLPDEQPADVEIPETEFERTLPTSEGPDERNQENELSEELSDMHIENEEDENPPASEMTDREENQNLETEVDNDDGDQMHAEEEDESLRASFSANLTITEKEKSEDKITDSVAEDAVPIVKRRGRKKKSFSDYELDCKPKASPKNQQPGVKKPRGRPKKSLSNLERPNDPNSSQEIVQSSLPGEKSHARDENVGIQNEESSRLDLHGGDNVKKPRGRPKTKNLLPTFVSTAKVLQAKEQPIVKKPRGRPKKSLSNLDQSNVVSEAELSIATESSVLAEKTSDEIAHVEQESLHSNVNTNDDSTVGETSVNEHPIVAKKPRGRRPKKSLSSCEPPSQPEVSEVNAVVVKKPRGRPKKSLSNLDQPLPQEKEQPIEQDISQETEHSIATEIDDKEDKDQNPGDEENQVLDREVFNHDEESQNTNLGMDYEEQESLHSKVDEDDTVAESNVLKPEDESEEGRPKESLSSLEHPIEQDDSRETEQSVASAIVDEESQDQRYDEISEDEESQVLAQDETSQHPNVVANDEERESQHSENTTDFVLTDKADSEESNTSEKPTVVASSCDRESESTDVQPALEMNDEEHESLHSNENTETTVADYDDTDTGENLNTVIDNEKVIVVKKPRGRPKKSLSSCDRESESTNVQAELEMNDAEQESLHSNVNTDTTGADYDVTDKDKQLNTVIDNEQPVVVKKPRGRPKKSLSSCDRESGSEVNDTNVKMNHEEEEDRLHSNATLDAGTKPSNVSDNERPIAVKKPRGRPRKSLSSCDRESETLVDNVRVQTEVQTNDEESLHSNVTFNKDLDVTSGVSENEHPIVVKKHRGRPKKSLTSCEMPSAHEANAVAVKKARGRRKKSLSSFEHSNVPSEAEVSVATESSVQGEKTNDEEDETQRFEDEENQVLNEEANQNPSIAADNEERESLHSEVTTSLTFTDKIDSEVSEKLNPTEKHLVVAKANEQPIVKKPRGRPKKSLSNLNQTDVASEAELSIATESSVLSEKTSDEIVHEEQESLSSNVNTNDDSTVGETSVNEHPIVAKEPRGRRPKKSLSNLDQSNVVSEAELSIATESSVLAEKNSDEIAHEEQESLHSYVNTNDDSTVGETSVNEHPIVAKKPRGRRPKKSLSSCEPPSQPEVRDVKSLSNCEQQIQLETHDETAVVVKKARGRPKKSLSNLEQPTERDPSQEREQPIVEKISDVCDENNEKDGRAECLNGAVDEVESQAMNDEVRNLDDTHETSNLIVHTEQDETLDSESVVDEPCNENSVDDQLDTTRESEHLVKKGRGRSKKPRGRPKKSSSEQHPDGGVQEEVERDDAEKRVNEDESSAMVSTLSQESVEVPKDEEESPITQEEESQDVKVQDDENKENKEKYSEEDEVKNEDGSSMTEQEKTEKADEEATKNNTSSRKYKSFDKINTQVIVENGKRKRKPKVLLYENEDLEISTRKKRKKDDSTLSRKNGSRKSFEKTQVESPLVSEEIVKNTEVKVKKSNLKNPVQAVAPTDSIEEPVKDESAIDENSMDTVTSDFSTTVSTHNDNETSTKKRHRRPKVLLYENEDLKIAPKSLKKRKVEFTLPTNENSMDSTAELPTTTKKKRKTPLLRKNHVQLSKEDLVLLKKFNIKLEPLVVLTPLPLSSKKRKSRKPHVIANKIRRPKEKTPFSHIKKLSDDPPLYECKVCKESFRTYSIRKFHAACPIKMYKCRYCPRKFNKNTHLQYHERGHTGDKPFGCDLCGLRFKMKYKLNRHMSIHKSMPDLECNECGRKFVSKENLKSHLISHVKSSYSFACNHCPRSFIHDANRKRHELSHSPVALFKCLRCPKSFKTKYDVARHVKTHEKLRPFACHDCGKTFLTKFEVRRHAVSHSEAKEYNCNYCEQQFGRYDNYARHMRHHHPDEDPMSVRPPENINGKTREVDEESSSSEEKRRERKKDQSTVKPKKISRSASNPTPMPISFSQSLTPQPAPAPYSISQNHDLASVIRETLPDLNNAVPVISAPVSAQPSSSLIDPIPLEQALILNRQIEEKMYAQSSFCEFPGLTRRNVTIVNRRQSYTYERRSSSGSNSNSNDGTSFLTMNQERYLQHHDEEEMNTTKKDIHVHWRRRTAETLKSKMDQNN